MSSTNPVPWWWHVAAVVASFAAGALVMYKDQRPKVEAPAPAIIQKDQSVILERNPDKPRPTLPMIPKGAQVIRQTVVEIQPRPEPSANPSSVSKPEEVELTTIQSPEGSRVIASSSTGQVLGGSDWSGPVGPPAHVYHWEAQAIRSFTWKGPSWGASLGYARGPFLGSVAVIPGNGGSFQLGIGARW